MSTCDDDHKQKSQLKDKIYFKFLRQSEDGGTEVISFKIFSSLSKAQQVQNATTVTLSTQPDHSVVDQVDELGVGKEVFNEIGS